MPESFIHIQTTAKIKQMYTKKNKLKKTDLLPIAKIRQNKIKKHIQTTVQLK